MRGSAFLMWQVLHVMSQKTIYHSNSHLLMATFRQMRSLYTLHQLDFFYTANCFLYNRDTRDFLVMHTSHSTAGSTQETVGKDYTRKVGVDTITVEGAETIKGKSKVTIESA